MLAACLAVAGCSSPQRELEVAYVANPQVQLRDRVAAVYNKAGTARNGERVSVLERNKRFVRVRTSRGEEGWMEQRYLVGQEVFDAFAALARENARAPVQAHGTTRAELNMHMTPGRDTERLYRLGEGEKVEMLRRATAPKASAQIGAATARIVATTAKPGAATQKPGPTTPKAGAGTAKPGTAPKAGAAGGAKSASDSPATAAAALEDWWLVRDKDQRYGWVLARMIDMDVPMEAAQYAEGQRIIGYFTLNTVPDADKKVAQLLMLLSEPHDGSPFDFDQLRVFTWNLKKHRYETAYRERNIFGMLPATVSKENFEKAGELPTFTIQVKDEQGNVGTRKYRLNGVMVQRVLAPGEERVRSAKAQQHSGRGKGHKGRR